MLPAYLPEPTNMTASLLCLKTSTEKRIEFKVLILTYKCLNNLAPPYRTDLLDVYGSSYTLRSGDQLNLECLSPVSNHIVVGLSPMLHLSCGMTHHQLSRLFLLWTYLNLSLSITCLTAVMVMYPLVDSLSAPLSW